MYFGKHLPQVVFLDTVRRTDSRLKQLYEATDQKEGRSWDGKKVRNMHFVCENICLTVLCYSEIFIYTLRVKVIIIKVSINFTGRDSA